MATTSAAWQGNNTIPENVERAPPTHARTPKPPISCSGWQEFCGGGFHLTKSNKWLFKRASTGAWVCGREERDINKLRAFRNFEKSEQKDILFWLQLFKLVSCSTAFQLNAKKANKQQNNNNNMKSKNIQLKIEPRAGSFRLCAAIFQKKKKKNCTQENVFRERRNEKRNWPITSATQHCCCCSGCGWLA